MGTRNARIGLILFFVYLALYVGFVFLSAFSPDTMEATPVAGINVAILYGFFLIISAIVLALIYGLVCDGNDAPGSAPTDVSSTGTEEGSK